MLLLKWKKIPDYMKNEQVKEYYEIIRKKKISLLVKRIVDILFSLVLIIITLPFMFIIALIIKIDSKGPVFYRQERVTTNGKIFKIFKFRTMIQDADKKGSLVTIGEDNRITNVGKKIRKLRLDEVPQLFNIFLGEMSFVGTRPEVKKYVDCYTDEMKATLLLPAGVTSRASIEYKNEDEKIKEHLKKCNDIDAVYVNYILPDKMEYNLDYLKKFSLIEDMKICVKTVLEVLK